MQTMAKEEEVIMNIADMAMYTYLAESLLLRVQKIVNTKGEDAAKIQLAIAKTYIYDAGDKIAKAAKDAINSYADGDEARMMGMGIKRFTKTEAINPKELRQQIAASLIEANQYNL
jgi:hypothetical protein